MPKTNWKSAALLLGISASGIGILLLSAVELLRFQFLEVQALCRGRCCWCSPLLPVALLFP